MTKKKTNEEFVNQVVDKLGDIFVFHNEYNGAKSKINFSCKNCGHEHNSHASNILNNMKGCSNYLCENYKGNFKKTDPNIYQNMLNEFHHETILILDKENLINARSKVNLLCNICNFSWVNSVNHLVHGKRKTGCPNCNRTSSLENIIKNWLDSNSIRYRRESTIKKVNIEGVLYKPRFDFELVDFNSVVEVHGRQHYAPIEFFGGEKGFIDIVKRDFQKKKICESMGINYIEISYIDIEDNSFEEILKDLIFNDYPEREYTQASGKGESSVKETE